MRRLHFLTGNRDKFLEVKLVLNEFGIDVVQVPRGKVEIQSQSLEEIAVYAVKNLRGVGGFVFTEDAGLFVRALRGFPGPYSSYVYRTIGIEGLLKLMEGVGDRSAYFESVVALRLPTGRVEVFRGRVEGTIATEARGSGGFGFDPIFVPDGQERTFAEMGLREKNYLSHRGRAVRSMAQWLLSSGVI